MPTESLLRSAPSSDFIKECIANGKMTVWGGTVRWPKGQSNGGQIVAHLKIPENIEQATNLLQNMAEMQSLQYATMALQGMNLAVSAVGFAIVISKLNNISKQLERMDYKLDTLQLTADRIERYQELIQYTRYSANLESLESSLRTRRSHMLDTAIINLRESQYLFQEICEMKLPNMKGLYQESEYFDVYFQGAVGSAMCIANAHAQLDQIPEAIKIVTDISEWQISVKEKICFPLEVRSNSVWLTRLSNQEKSNAKNLIQTQRYIPEGLSYTNNIYQLCDKKGISISNLMSENKNDIIFIGQ